MQIQECRKFNLRFVLSVAFGGTLLLQLAACGHSKDTYLQKGEEFLQKRKFHEAVMQFRSAADVDKSSAPAHWGLARAYENLGQFNETLDELRKTIELEPDNLDAKAKLGNYYLLTQPPMITEAEKTLDEIFAKNPAFIEGFILKASILAAKEKPENEVVGVLDQAIAADPTRTESYLSKARYYMSREKSAEAEDAIKKGIAANPNRAVGYIEYGRFLTFADRAADAEAQYKKASEVEPDSIEARQAIAEFYVAQRQYDKAENTYKQLIQIQENSPESRLDLANFYTQINRGDEAVKVLSDILNDAPEYVRARYRLAEMYLDRRENAKAGEQVETLLQANGGDPEALMLRARIRLQENKAEDAIKDLEDVLKKKPSQREALFYMTQARLALGQTDQAKAFIGDLDKYHPKYLKTGLLKIQAAFASGENETALRLSNEFYGAVKNTYPNTDFDARDLQELTIKALTSRGLANLGMGKIAEAKTDLQEVARMSPNSASAYVNLAKISLTEKNLPEALNFYQKALTADAKNFEALSGKINVLTKQKQSQQAHAEIDRNLVQNTDTPDISAAFHYLKSEIYKADGNNAARESELKKAIELDDDYLPAYSSYAELLLASNQADAAAQEYRKILDKKPSASVYTLLGMLEDGRGNSAEAEKNYRKALEIEPDLPIAANNLAWMIAENQGNLDEALQLAQKSVNQTPNAAEYFDTLGWVYYKKGLLVTAIEQAKKAVALDEAASKRAGIAANQSYRQRLNTMLTAANNKPSAMQEVETTIKKAQSLSISPTQKASGN